MILKNKFVSILVVQWVIFGLLYLVLMFYRTDPELRKLLLQNTPIYLLAFILVSVFSSYIVQMITKRENTNVTKLAKMLSPENLFTIEYEIDDDIKPIIDKLNMFVENYNELLYQKGFVQTETVVDNQLIQKMEIPLSILISRIHMFDDEDKEHIYRLDRLLTQYKALYIVEENIQESGFDLDYMVQEILIDLRSFIEFKQLNVKVEGDLPVVRSDQKLLRVALENIISNAVKFAYWETEVIITASNSTIAVSNISEPIPEEELPKIWEKYYSTTNDPGVGLHIIKTVFDKLQLPYGIENHKDGVTIWFEI